MELSLVNAALSFGAGLGSVLSPCVLPVVPLVVTGTEKDSPWRPVAVVAGLATTFVLMGVAGSLLGAAVLSKMALVEKVAGALIAVMGALLALGVNPFKRVDLGFLQRGEHRDGLVGGALLGATLGVVWIPCVGPMLSGVLAMVATDGTLLGGIALLVVYSLGFSVPMLVVAWSSHHVRARWFALSRAHVPLRVASGLLLLALGVWIAWKGALIVL